MRLEESLGAPALEAVLLADRAPRRRHVDLRGDRLGAARRDRHARELAGARRATVALAKLPRRALDHLSPPRPARDQLIRDAGDLEVAALPARPALQRQPEAAQLLRELRAIPRAVDPLRAKQLARVNRREAAVVALRREQHDVGVKLRVRHTVAFLIASQPRRGVHELGGDEAARRLLAQCPALAATYHRHLALDPRQRARHSPAVRDLDLRATVRTGHRPQRRDRLRRAERQIDPRHARPVGTDAADRLPGPRRAALHQRDQVGATNRHGRVEAELAERLWGAEPHAALTLQLASHVVVTAARRRRQIGRETGRRAARDLVGRLHAIDRRSGPERGARGPRSERI